MNILIYFTIFLGLSVIFRNILEDTLLWQIKEYRIDKVITHLKGGNEPVFRGKFVNLFKFLAFLFSLIFYVPLATENIERWMLILAGILITYYAYTLFKEFKNILNKTFLRPKISIRNFLIVGMTIATILIPILINTYILTKLVNEESFYYFWSFLFITIIILLDLIEPLIVSLFVFLTSPLASYRRKRLIRQAKSILSKRKKLITIGITGSYGKSSTKEILAKILASKYQVVITPANQNTPVGIALAIINELQPKTQIFIAEMGAYRKGEILECTKVVPLDIAVITTVGKAHLDIYGSVENIAETKSEILQGLKNNGKAILNGDNSYTFKMTERESHEVFTFSMKDSFKFGKKNIVKITNIQWQDELNAKFTLSYKSNSKIVETKIVGQHQIQNLLAACTVAISLGFTVDELANILSKTDFESSHFKISKGYRNTIIIDDSYTSNPEGFSAAINHLKNSKAENKIIVTKGISEIGKEIKYVYKQLVPQIVNSSNTLITSDPVLFKETKNSYPKFNSIFVTDTKEMNDAVKKFLHPKNLILIEGRIHPDTHRIIEKGN